RPFFTDRDGNVGPDQSDLFLRQLHQMNSLFDSGFVGVRKALIQGVAAIGDESLMKIQPDRRIFQVGVHSRERAAHRRVSIEKEAASAELYPGTCQLSRRDCACRRCLLSIQIGPVCTFLPETRPQGAASWMTRNAESFSARCRHSASQCRFFWLW